jgi:glucose-6-phosphate isomerase
VTLTVSLAPPLHASTQEAIEGACAARFASRVVGGDATLWGPEAVSEASIRLGWAQSPDSGNALVKEALELKKALAENGVVDFVLCGMGGSSLAPEVMAKTSGLALEVVDSTHPGVLAPLLSKDLSTTAVIVSSKSGGTIETDSKKRAFEAAFLRQHIDPTERMIIITDPGSPLHQSSVEAGYRVFLGNPNIGGRFSALSVFGLVPATLIGMDTHQLVSDALSAWETCSTDSLDNPALLLGAALASDYQTKNKIILRPLPGLPGLGDWVEQLVAESTGKQGQGLLPVVDSTVAKTPDSLVVGPKGAHPDIAVSGTLGELFVLWQFATAFACHLMSVNAFDQPNVESAKVAARSLLDEGVASGFVSTPIPGAHIWQSSGFDHVATSLEEMVTTLFSAVGERNYLALAVFGGPDSALLWQGTREHLEVRLGRPVTLGVGPRYLHSTGQLHKGGAPEGVFLIVVERPLDTVEIPGREFDFGTLVLAQAEGDARVLCETGQPVCVVWVDSPSASQKLRDALTRES